MVKKKTADFGSKKVGTYTTQAESTTTVVVAHMPQILAPQDSTLLGLPEEVKQNIYKLAVKEKDDIIPVQIREKSNKFIWSKKQLVKAKDPPKISKIVISAVPQLTAMSLAQTCHQIYDEVSLTNLFYQVNTFDFKACSHMDALAYLVAITDARRNNIKSARIGWDDFQCEGVLITLASCENIETFEVVVGEYMYRRWCYTTDLKLDARNTFSLLLVALQGVKDIKLILPSEDAYNVTDSTLKAHRDKVVVTAIAELKGQSKVERGTNLSIDKLNKARLAANLHVHGEGRLGVDKKPGVIASRTRQQIKNAEKLDADGVIPKAENPKYAVDGDLAWWVDTIEASREVLDTDGSVSSVEFLVVCRPDRFPYVSNIKEVTWEDLSALNNFNARESILCFYLSHSGSEGKQIVADVWKLLSDERDQPRYMRNSRMLKHLQMIIEKDAKGKEKSEEARGKKSQVKASQKAARIALKTKRVAKKTKRGESA